MVILSWKLLDPPVFVAMITKSVGGNVPVGVPDILPVDGSIESPTGSAGDTEKEDGVSPLNTGSFGATGKFLV
jgi:hypothetical protein